MSVPQIEIRIMKMRVNAAECCLQMIVKCPSIRKQGEYEEFISYSNQPLLNQMFFPYQGTLIARRLLFKKMEKTYISKIRRANKQLEKAKVLQVASNTDHYNELKYGIHAAKYLQYLAYIPKDQDQNDGIVSVLGQTLNPIAFFNKVHRSYADMTLKLTMSIINMLPSKSDK